MISKHPTQPRAFVELRTSGRPHCGHAAAVLLTSPPHSVHLSIAIELLSLFANRFQNCRRQFRDGRRLFAVAQHAVGFPLQHAGRPVGYRQIRRGRRFVQAIQRGLFEVNLQTRFRHASIVANFRGRENRKRQQTRRNSVRCLLTPFHSVCRFRTHGRFLHTSTEVNRPHNRPIRPPFRFWSATRTGTAVFLLLKGGSMPRQC